ncbi:DUF2141 domain-containing protein [uncultured Paraglaciecola sp.]|uniref:DUF2141 domain-containing protein n=1 Tax=uncultured Paraglaciecola sp. TaxID=1765024 RepID=UPI0030DB1B5C|tara:strand:- start:19469 stop:19981 length:513 start_codon:yes stop_codon:yes gene_type:complete
MNKLYKVHFLVGFLYALFIAPCAISASLTLEIQGHENNQGQLHIAISQVKGSLHDGTLWDDLESVRKIIENIDTEQALQPNIHLIIEGLPIGFTCIRLYLDLNNNQLLERSSMGFPLEPVGFSNNPSLFNGEPTPLESCFLLQENANLQKIELKRHKKRKRKSKLGVVIN